MAAASGSLEGMDDDVESNPRWIRPETDLTEGNAWCERTELLPERLPDATEKGVWIDEFDGPVILP